MKKWLIVHNLESFRQNPQMIGFAAKTKLDGSLVEDNEGKAVPAITRINEIKPGDRIVYYCTGDSVIKGIYEVVQPLYAEEKQWPGSPFQFEIKPIIELEDPLDFRLLLSSLELLSGLPDLRKWGMILMGITNSVKPLSEHDYNLIEESLTKAQKQSNIEKEEVEGKEPNYRQHLLLQHQIAEWGLNNDFRVHIATGDKNKIGEKLPRILDDIPKFHRDLIVDIAKRIDVLFFEKERDILTHAFEVEHTTNIYSGLLRLNDIAESYPSKEVKFYIVSHKDNKDKFYRELERPSFYLLSRYGCEFVDYEQVAEQWKELKNRKPPLF